MLLRHSGPPARPAPPRAGQRTKARKRAPRQAWSSPTPPQSVNQPIQWKKYHAILWELVDHVHGRVITEDEVTVNNRYHKNKKFTPEEPSLLTPDHIYRFFANVR